MHLPILNIAPGVWEFFSLKLSWSSPCRFTKQRRRVREKSIFWESSWQTGNEPRFPPQSFSLSCRQDFFFSIRREQSICAVLHAAHTLLATYSTTKQQRAAGKIGNQVFKMKLVCCEELGSTRDSLPVLNPLARKMNLILLTQMTFEALSHK